MRLEAHGLTAGHRGVPVVRELDLRVEPGQVHVLLGNNGAGKTTLLHTVAGLLRPIAGSVRLAGAELAGRPAHRVARAGVGLVPQGRRLFASLTVAEHLSLAGRAGSTGARWTRARLLELLPRLAERLQHRGDQLSGGEQQMVAIARALLGQPRLLLLDEPVEGLAPGVAAQIRGLVRGLADEGVAVLLAAPQLELAVELADQVTVLAAGAPVEACTGDRLRADPGAVLGLLGGGGR